MAARRVDDDEDMLTTGALDSLSIARLIAFLEGSFGINVPMCDVVPENMATIAALTAYVTSRQSSAANVT